LTPALEDGRQGWPPEAFPQLGRSDSRATDGHQGRPIVYLEARLPPAWRIIAFFMRCIAALRLWTLRPGTVKATKVQKLRRAAFSPQFSVLKNIIAKAQSCFLRMVLLAKNASKTRQWVLLRLHGPRAGTGDDGVRQALETSPSSLHGTGVPVATRLSLQLRNFTVRRGLPGNTPSSKNYAHRRPPEASGEARNRPKPKSIPRQGVNLPTRIRAVKHE
jgi:hypothetical protein